METQLPDSVAPFAGRILDVDSHEQMPAQVWVETFGEVMRPFADIKIAQRVHNRNHPSIPDYAGDKGDIDPGTIWKQKGPTSPAAYDMNRRPQVLDAMHVKRQLMFPTSAGLYGTVLYGAPEDSGPYQLFGDRTYEMAQKMMTAGNEWMVEAARVSDRVRPVASVYGDTTQEIMAVAKDLIDRGIKAIMMMAGRLPGGLSPAHNDLDPFYAMLAEANVPLTLHVGSELMFFRTMDWGKAKAFEGFMVNDEISMDPWRLSAMTMAPSNYVATLVTGGVFDRHPTLRVGVVEFGASFIGPLADVLDMWHDNNQMLTPSAFADGEMRRKLPMRPFEYIKRNVRVSPFDFEPIGTYIRKYGLDDVYCFASDYPHVEGGSNPIGRLAELITSQGYGRKELEKFFCTNAELVLPA